MNLNDHNKFTLGRVLKFFGAFLILIVLVVGLSLGYQFYKDQVYFSEGDNVKVEAVASNIGQLWGIDFIPNSTLLIATERKGKMFIINTESFELVEIKNVPTVVSQGQGGLLDIAVSPEFTDDTTIFLTYVTAGDRGSATRLASATLDLDNALLTDLKVLYTAPFQRWGSHFGSRVTVDGDYLFMTLGDRGDKDFSNHVSQNTLNPYGSVIRLYRDGDVPAENPFVKDVGILDEIYSFGHRNPQGMTLQPETGALWISDHGEYDGDEINIIRAGGNYGWPIAHTGCSYVTRQPFGELPWEREDTIDPVYYWECGTGGFPPAGMTFYQGEVFLPWQGDLFIGGLASRYLAHFRLKEDGLTELEPLLDKEGWRVRDVTVGPTDGFLYVAVEGSNVSLVRILPEWDE